MKSIAPVLFIIIAFCFWECQQEAKSTISKNDKEHFERYIKMGDSIYATKKGFDAFSKSMVYYDSAMLIAQRTKDTLMLADGIFCKGTVYDAWNNEPLKTIEYFTNAALLYKKLNKDKIKEFYTWHLVAHAYDKMKDSANCTDKLLMICDSIKTLPIELRKKMEFIPQMAYISTEIKNYDLAEKILNDFYRRDWIKNNPKTYNYEDFYFMTKSRIDVYKNKINNSPYIDSFSSTLQRIKNPIDSLWYINLLVDVYRDAQNYQQAFLNLNIHKNLDFKVTNRTSLVNMQNELLNLELQAERKKLEAEQEARKSRNIIWSILIAALLIISFLLLRILKGSKRYQQQSERLEDLNTLLESKVQEVQLVNKEIQHRIKNNLHLIFSLLNMQERKSDNPDTIENLQKARLRIESIAGLHNQLSKNDNSEVNFSDYIQNLVKVIIDCIEIEHKVITNLSIDKINVTHNYYFSIGLILNEWITNSIKYAETQSPLVLTIKIQQLDENVAIEYYDNGKVKNNNNIKIGLGKEIIVLLTKQMKGSISFHENNPFHYYLIIKNGK